MNDSEVHIVSLLSGDFGSGRWSGGRATATDAYYEYRTAEGKKGKFTVTEAHVIWQDSDGMDHDVRYGVGGGDWLCIREEPDEDSAEATKGYGLSGRNGKQARISLDSEFGQLLAALYNNGVPESRIGKDIRGIIGVDAELVEKPHPGQQAGQDKYPMLLPTEVYGVGKKGSGASKRAVDEDEDEPKPKKGAGAASGSGSGSSSSNGIEKRAVKLVLSAAKDNDGTTTSSDVIRAASKALKGDEDRKAILDLLGDDGWYQGRDEWVFKKRTGEIVVE